MSLFLISTVATATYFDLKSRRIPNWLTYGSTALSLLYFEKIFLAFIVIGIFAGILFNNLIKSKEESGKFTFSFLGATLDAVDIAEKMNIRRDNSAYFEKSMMKDAVFNRVSNSINDYMDRKRKGENLSKF